MYCVFVVWLHNIANEWQLKIDKILYQRRYDTRASIRLIASVITLSVGG